MDVFIQAMPFLLQAFSLIFQPEQLMFLSMGVLLGLSVGVLPGLGGIAGLSLVLPFIYGMEPISGLAMMVGLIAVIPTSDTFSSVLMGIPGSSASQATVLDGFPLAKRGEATRALSAAFIASLFGGLFGAVVLTFFILIARPLVLAFGLPEMLMITILGLSMVAILAGKVPLKGIISAFLGLLVGTIGAGDAGGSPRMSQYEWSYLYDGLKLVIVGLGIFAIPEIISLLRHDKSIANDAKLGSGWFIGIKDWWSNKFLSFRCALIGVIVGVIPGLGGSVVDWIAYGHTVQTSKDKSQFGKGDIRGVIGPESSNNAKEGGGLVPTLIFGIPGSGSMAIFIGGMALLGFDAGPQMITNNLDITYTLVWSLALANVLGAGLCILLSTPIARLTTIPFAILTPFLFMLISFAAFQSGEVLWDLATLFAIGLIGIFLRRFDWSRPGFLIGFVLSNQVENYSYQAYQVAGFKFAESVGAGFSYIFTPIVIVLIIITVISVVVGLRQVNVILPEGDIHTKGKRAPIIFLMVILLYVTVTLINSLMINNVMDKILPVFISSLALIGCLALLYKMKKAEASDPIFADREASGEDAQAPHGLWASLSWLASLLILASLFGFIIALVIFFISFLRLRAAQTWLKTFIFTGSGIGFLLIMANTLNRDFPSGLLQSYLRLPWPFN